MSGEIEVRVLGAMRLKIDAIEVPLSSGKAALIAALAFVHPESASTDQLSRLIWENAPAQSRKALQNQVKRLRAEFGKEIIETIGSGYRLGSSVLVDDLDEFTKPVDTKSDTNELRSRLQLWHGQPYAELAPEPDVWLERDRLETQRLELLGHVGTAVLKSRDHIRIREFLDAHGDELLDRPDVAGVLARLRGELRTGTKTSRRGSPLTLSRDQESIVDAMSLPVSSMPIPFQKSQAMVVFGPAGSGKTTILDAFESELLDETLVLRSACTEAPAAAHETIAGLLSGLGPSVVINPHLRLVDRLIEALSRFEQRVFVIIDDFHWATLALCEVVERIGREATHAVVVVATRDAQSADAILQSCLVTRFEAPALDKSALELLVRSIISPLNTESRHTGEVASEILFMTAGAPLFASKLIEELSAAGAFIEDEGEWVLRSDHPVPQSLFETVTSRYSALPMQARHFVEMAAILHQVGGDPSTEYLEERYGSGRAEAERSGLVRKTSARSWSMHSEVARTVLESLSEGAKAELHAVAADRLRNVAPIGAARHALRAPTLPPALISLLVEDAGTHAYAEADYATAVEMWDNAVRLARADGRCLEELIDLAMQRCDAARRAGHERQLEIMAELVDLVEASGDVERMAIAVRIICKLGASSDVEPLPEFVAFAEKTLNQDLSPAGRAGVLAATTQLYALNNFSVVRDRFLEAYKIAMQLDDGDLIRFVLPGAYMSVSGPHDLQLRTNIGHELLDRGDRDSDPTAEWEAHHLLWSCAAIGGDRAAMVHHYRSAASLPGSRSEPVKAATISYMEASDRFLQGDLAGAQLATERFLGLSNAVGPQRSMAVYGALLLGIRRDQGRLDEMLPLIRDLHEAQPTVIGWQGVLAWLLSETGAQKDAAPLISELVRGNLTTLPLDIAHTAVLYIVAQAATNVSSAEECGRLLALLLPYEGMMSWTGTASFGPMDQVLGQLAYRSGDPAKAARFLEAAELVGQRNEWPAIEMRAQLAQASLDLDAPASQQLVRAVFARALQLDVPGVARHARELRRG